MTTNNEERPMQHYSPKPEEAVPLTITPEKQALLRAVDIYLKCPTYPDKPCPDDCKLLRRHIGEWAICSHLQQAGELMLKREALEDKGFYNTRTGGYVKWL